jgi:predicted TIM-barrel fold metal-dependent hydrolase
MRPIIDVHVHLYPPRRMGGLMRWLRREIPDHPVPDDVTVGQVVADLEGAGVERFCAAVFPIGPGEAGELNRFLAELSRSVPGMVPLGSVHPDDPDPEGLAREAFRDLGLEGIKLHPQVMKISAADPRLGPVFSLAQEAGRFVLVHTELTERHGPAREREMEEWERLFSRYPRLPFVLAHMFFPDLSWAFSLAERFDNLFLDLTNVPELLAWPGESLPFGVPRGTWGREELAAAFESHPGRVVFGSDHPAGMGSLAEVIRGVETLGLSEGTLRGIMYGNARGLFDRLGL